MALTTVPVELASLDGAVTVNESSADADFRVESNGNTHMIFVDAGSDHVNIGTSTDHGGVLNVQTTDNTVNLVLASTDTDANEGPIMDFTRDAGNVPSDGDVMGVIRFRNDNTDLVMHNYATIETRTVDVSAGTEDGRLEIATVVAGTEGTSRMLLDGGETVFNDNSADLDFRVESDADGYAFFINGGDSTVNFGGSDTTRTISGLVPKFQGNSLTRMDSSIGLVNNSNDTLSSMIMFGKTRSASRSGHTVAAAGDAIGSIVFNPSDGTDMGHTSAAIDAVVTTGIQSNDVPAALRFYTNEGTTSSAERVRMDQNGALLVGTTAEGGAISNNFPVTAGRFRTFTDTIGAANNTATTMVSLSTAFATYIACVGFNGVGNTNLYGASAIIHSDGTSHTLTHLANPSNMTLSMSGSNVQATQTSGATLNISFSIIRIQ